MRPSDTPYLRACNGRLKGVLRWQELDDLWARLQRPGDDGWFVYTIGESPPTAPSSREELQRFLTEVRQHLRDEHKEDYCGIVYVDDPDEPRFVKIFDPNNLGMVCGSSDRPTLPGWTLSRVAPDDLSSPAPRPGLRRWLPKILG